MTQKELADLFTAFSREFLSDLENGKPTVELGKALAVASALGLRVYVEFDGDVSAGGSR
jgi:transcriptional regulator with XRE-family HTH domain